MLGHSGGVRRVVTCESGPGAGTRGSLSRTDTHANTGTGAATVGNMAADAHPNIDALTDALTDAKGHRQH